MIILYAELPHTRQ